MYQEWRWGKGLGADIIQYLGKTCVSPHSTHNSEHSDLEYIPKKRKGLFETFPSFGPCFIAVFYLQGLICLSDYLSSLSIYLLIPLFTLLFIHFPCYHMFCVRVIEAQPFWDSTSMIPLLELDLICLEFSYINKKMDKK